MVRAIPNRDGETTAAASFGPAHNSNANADWLLLTDSISEKDPAKIGETQHLAFSKLRTGRCWIDFSTIDTVGARKSNVSKIKRQNRGEGSARRLKIQVLWNSIDGNFAPMGSDGFSWVFRRFLLRRTLARVWTAQGSSSPRREELSYPQPATRHPKVTWVHGQSEFRDEAWKTDAILNEILASGRFSCANPSDSRVCDTGRVLRTSNQHGSYLSSLSLPGSFSSSSVRLHGRYVRSASLRGGRLL